MARWSSAATTVSNLLSPPRRVEVTNLKGLIQTSLMVCELLGRIDSSLHLLQGHSPSVYGFSSPSLARIVDVLRPRREFEFPSSGRGKALSRPRRSDCLRRMYRSVNILYSQRHEQFGAAMVERVAQNPTTHRTRLITRTAPDNTSRSTVEPSPSLPVSESILRDSDSKPRQRQHQRH